MNLEQKGKVTLTEKGIQIGEKYEILLCASLFYFRLPRSVWKDRIEKLKATGYNCVDVYFPWNYHEKKDGTFDFEEDRDIGYFLKSLAEAGLYVIARPGPYICSEWSGGAIPSRILESGVPIRCADEFFLRETKKWYRAVLPQILPYEYGRGGSVILVQLENELDFFDCPDPEKYISALRDSALQCGVTVPLFCCCGQFEAERACGFSQNVFITLNCYPSSDDPSFDQELRRYAELFQAESKPLLVSETNRDHFLLRRELSCGAKLLGAYNQVAGNNFEYYQAVNNWGKPEAFLVSVYDFESMIDSAGNYREEALQAVSFSSFLKVMGEEFAQAVPCGTVKPNSSEFVTCDGGLNVLRLKNGGYAVCVPNFGTQGGSIQFSCNDTEMTAFVPPKRAPFCLFGLELVFGEKTVRLTRTNCEPIFMSSKKLVLRGNACAMVGLDFGDGEKILRTSCVQNGIEILILDDEQSVAYLTDGAVRTGEYSKKSILAAERGCTLPEWREVQADNGLNFGALGISEGEAEYEVRIPASKKLYIENPCDIVTVTAAGIDGESRFADGHDLILAAADDGKYLVRAEKWGHSNFDDSQVPATRIACKKGVCSFGVVQSERKIGRCDFKLLDSYGDDTIDLSRKIPARLGVNSWNSTRKPVVCAYSFKADRFTDKLLLKTAEDAEIAVYSDGKHIGECDFGSFDLTPFVGKGESRVVTLVYRKRVWTQNCGDVVLYDVDAVKPEKVCVLDAEQMKKFVFRAAGTENFPVSLGCGECAVWSLDLASLKNEGFMCFHGHNIRITCVIGGRVVGRVMIDWEKAPALTGGEPDRVYFCPAWSAKGEKLFVYAESAGKNACLSGIDFLSAEC